MNDLEPIQHVGFGCVALTRSATASQALKLLETAYDNGIIHFDTAPLYGQGYSEKIVGAFIRRKREYVTVTSKFGLGGSQNNVMPSWMALPLNNLKKKILKPVSSAKPSEKSIPVKLPYRKILLADVKNSFNKSMQYLKTDYLDYYLLHEGMPHFLAEGVFEFLSEKKAKGIIRQIGIGCNAVNFLESNSSEIKGWDLLQYKREDLLNTNKVTNLFPQLNHIQHSIFKNVHLQLMKEPLNDAIKGALLALAVKQNPQGKILFSTSKLKHLVSNIKAFNQQISLSEADLTEIISNAFH